MASLKARRTALALAVLVSYAGYAYAQEQPPVTVSRPTIANPLAQFDPTLSEPWVADTDFVWGARLAAFDLPDYLNRTAPHLSAQAQFIAHWCGFYSISPKVLLTILEMQSALVSTPPPAGVLANPLAGLVPGDGFEQQVLNALSALFQDFHAYRNATAASPAAAATNAATYALLNLLRGQASPQAFGPGIEQARARFLETLSRMFPEPLASIESSDAIADVPPVDLLQFPWKNGVWWVVGGAHTTTGMDDGSPMSSLDSSRGGQGWGADTSTDYVVAAHAGTVTVFSSCNVRVTSASGWQTNYYHLGGVIVSTGQHVAANQTLGVYANTAAQAVCEGGSSSGPHVHYSLLKDGVHNSLNGVTWNGYVIQPGRYSYDTNPLYMWLSRNGVKKYANSLFMSHSSTLPNMTINDVSVAEGNSGTKSATFTVHLSTAASTTTTANYQTEHITTAAGDLVAASGVVTIATGASIQTLSITINGDTAAEPAETFRVRLSGAANAIITDDIGIGTIQNDDATVFTDTPLDAGVTSIKAIHVTELRTRIDAVRAARGLGAYTFTDDPPAGVTIKSAHILEMRTAITQAYAIAGIPAPTFTDASLTDIPVKTTHINELRSAVIALE
jgi:LasA protease